MIDVTGASVSDRFMPKIAKPQGEGGCWLWTASLNHHGYGQFGISDKGRRRPHLAHRVAYELLVGPIPKGMQIDHLCRNPRCVNPAHLEPVTPAENTRRGLVGVLKTHCPQGHPYDAENTYYAKGAKHRLCRTCNRERGRARLRGELYPSLRPMYEEAS